MVIVIYLVLLTCGCNNLGFNEFKTKGKKRKVTKLNRDIKSKRKKDLHKDFVSRVELEKLMSDLEDKIDSKIEEHDQEIYISARDKKSGISLLHLAVKSSKKEIISILIDFGIDAEDKDIDGNTAIRHTSDLAILKFLVGMELDINSKDNFGNTILHDSCRNAGWFLYDLIELGLDVNAENNLGYRPIHFLVKCSIEFNTIGSDLDDLIRSGAEIDAKNKEGRTPLHLASIYGSLDAAANLLDAGANLSIRDNKGMTPLDLSFLYSDMDNNELQQLLNEKAKEVKGMKYSPKSLLKISIESLNSRDEIKQIFEIKRVVDSLNLIEVLKILIEFDFSSSDLEDMQLVKDRLVSLVKGPEYDLFVLNQFISFEAKDLVEDLEISVKHEIEGS